MASAKRVSAISRFRRIRDSNSREWKLVKHFFRSGKRSATLSEKTLRRAVRTGLDYKESQNRRSGRPYTGVLSAAEKKEVARQMRGLVSLVYPSLSVSSKGIILKLLVREVALINRQHVEHHLRRGDFAATVSTGKMYLTALDRRNAAKGRRRGDEEGLWGLSPPTGQRVILRRDWMKSRYGTTTPLHEACHVLFGSNEFKAYLADFYYGLKEGIFQSSELYRYPLLPIAKKARKTALELVRMGHAKGWRSPDKIFRSILSKE
ncbi:MAG: hypothetical protein Q7R47_00305 [Candidatus Diapherotrites archaeon]|nr:hypothetical protein [Candidatus Diapherotrites archaeon]